MRIRLLAAAVLALSMMSGCTESVEPVDGEAAPAGTPVSPSATAAPSTPPPSPTPAARPSASGGASPSGGARPTPTSEIRRTDWRNVSLGEPRFLDGRRLTFRNGTATVGDTTCTMLPGGARPVYGEFLTEEPANSPVTEDALVLVDCAGDQRRQTLLLVQIGYDQKTRGVNAHIAADPPDGSSRRTTFLSYSLDGYDVVTTVRKADGGTERRRYRHAGGSNWDRV